MCKLIYRTEFTQNQFRFYSYNEVPRRAATAANSPNPIAGITVRPSHRNFDSNGSSTAKKLSIAPCETEFNKIQHNYGVGNTKPELNHLIQLT